MSAPRQRIAEAQENVDRTTGIYHIRQGFTGEKWLDMVNFTARPLEVDRSKRPSAKMLLMDSYLEQARCLQDSVTDCTPRDDSTLHEPHKSVKLSTGTYVDGSGARGTLEKVDHKKRPSAEVQLEGDVLEPVTSLGHSSADRDSDGNFQQVLHLSPRRPAADAVPSKREMPAPRQGRADRARPYHSPQMDFKGKCDNEVRRVVFPNSVLKRKISECYHRESYNTIADKRIVVLDQDSGDCHVTFHGSPLEVPAIDRASNDNSGKHKLFRSSKNSGGHGDRTVDDEACSEETPAQASKSEKSAEDEAVKLKAELTPVVTNDQTNPDVLDEVDNETVDDYACSEEAPASKSEKPDNFNEVLLVLEQMLMVVKGTKKRFNVNVQDETGYADFVKEIVDDGGVFMIVNNEGMSLLHISAFVGQYKATLVLLMRHAASQTGDTLLHLAVQYGHTRVVKSLLDSLANCNLLNVSGHTSLYLACQHGYKDVVHLLLKPFPGALQTPLHIAVKHGQVECLRFLIQYGYAVDTKGMSETSLHEVFLYRKLDVVRFFLKVGADMLALSGLGLAPLDVGNQYTDPRSSQDREKVLQEFFTPGTMNAFDRSNFDSFLAWFSVLLKQKEAEVLEVCLQGFAQTDMTEAQTDERQLWQDEKRQIHMKNGLLLCQWLITGQDEHSSYLSERVPASIFVYNESCSTLVNMLLLFRVWRDICDGKSPDPVSCGTITLPFPALRLQLPDEVKNKLKSRLRLALQYVKENADSLRQYNSNVDTSEYHNKNIALQRCQGLLQRAYRIVSKEQKLNYYCASDELKDCMEVHTVIYECSQLLKSVIDLNTGELEVDRFEEAYARVRQSFADIRKNVERWRDAVLHSTVALFSKGSFNSTVRQLMNRNVATFGKGGNGEVVEAFQSGRRLIVKKTLLRESEWSIATEMSHPNVMPWLALICGGRSDSKPGQIVSYQVMPKMTEDLSASIRKMGGSIHHYILQLQESEEPNAVLSARADLVRLRGAEILRRILQGLDYMHQRNVVHRDIKASNILLKKPVDCPHEAVHTCTCPGGWQVKVADFDSVIHLGVARDRARRRKQLKVGNTGTSGYRAPEVFYESSTSDINDPDYYSPASDIWSFGGVCLHLAMGFCCPRMQYQVSLMTLAHHRMVNIPAAEAQEKVDRTMGIYHIRQGFTGEKWLDMVNFTARPLEVDRSRRPTAAMLLEDPFLEQAKHERENDLTDDNTNGNFLGHSLTNECQEAESSNSGESKRKSSKSPEGTVAQQ